MEKKKMRQKRGQKQNKRSVQRLVCLGIVVLGCLIFLAGYVIKQAETEETMSQTAVTTMLPETTAQPTATPASAATPNPEKGIYTFLQGPKSWQRRLKWSGSWGTTFYDGGSFGGFGCGLCCIANVYSSFTKYRCTPVDAYYYAKKHTGYSGGGAIAWGYMRRTLTSLGFTCSVAKKTNSYQDFQKKIADSKAAIVLVSSSNSTCYWKDTPGHYVTIFLYDKGTDRIFLADSGDPEHNRHWVSLRKIYQSLKTSSPFQYLYVSKYNEKKDQWKHKQAEGDWVR